MKKQGRQRQQTTKRGCWYLVERLVLALELPAVFAFTTGGAILAFLNDKAAAGLILLCLAAIPALAWAHLARRD